MNRPNTQQQQEQGDGTREANENIKKEAVFDFHGKHLVYPRSSLYLFSEKSRVRVACVKLVAHPWFDRFILLVIALNSIVLALTDWTRIDEDPSSEDVGEPIAEGSWRNTLLYKTEGIFTAIFTLEFVLKVVSQGFIFGHGAYLRDAWNVLDFVVVVTALLTSIPGMPTATAIRVFRVLRPLRSLSTLPGLQHLVVSMLKSVPQLVSVLILLQFIFVVFGILGIQLFAGKQHSRCRLTPYPVTTAFETGMDYADHRCLEASNFDVVDEDNSWTQSSSPWSTPQDCWWPLDTDDTRLCAFDDSPGNHQCEHDPAYLNESDFRWCGSDYDALGNRRFEGGVTLEGSPWGGWNLTDNATFVEDLAWGYTTFDNIFVAFLTIFQSITLEGWSDILYQVKDCSRPVLADLFFIVLVLWGAFFTLNLLLAVLETNFSQGKEEEEARQAAAAAEQRQQEQQADSSIDDVLGASVEEKAIAAEREVEDGEAGVKDAAVAAVAAAAAADGLSATEEGRRTGGGEGAAWGVGGEGGTREELHSDSCHSISSSGSGGSEAEGYRYWRLALWRLTASAAFQRSITTLIILNTLTLALDHHPMDEDFSTVLDLLNLVFTLCFALEMALKLVALGPRGYAKDKFNLFDGLVVLSSLVELAIWPPDILTGGDGEDWGGGLSALRSFRVLRILKLARGWSSMRDLLETLRKTLLDIGNFALLLLLFMFIYVLIGVQFFANRLHFAEDGRVIGIGEEGYYDAEVPRSNFDTLLHAFTTVFEVLSGENWNATMYSARRAVGWVSVFYFVSLIIVGMMIVMSLFLAILLSHFATPEQDEADAEDRERRQEKEKLEQQGLAGATPAKDEEGKNGVGMKGEEEEEDVAARKEDAERNGNDGGNKGPRKQGRYTSELDESFRGANSFFDSDSPGTAAQRALWRAHSAASAAPFGSVGTRGFPHATGVMEVEGEEQEEEHAQEHHLTNSNNNNSDAEVAGNWDTDESPDNGSDGVEADANGNHFASEREENAGCFARGRLGASVAGYAAGAVRSVKVPENIYPGFALCCLSAKNPLRRGCAAVVSNAGFSRLVTLLIVLSSLTVALDTPLRDPDSTAAGALGALEVALTFLFVLECVLKVCASGFFFMPLAYLRDAWNVLDFGVVMVSVVQLFLIRGAGLSGLRSLRALRALRPLRIVKRFPGLKLVLEALIGSVQGVFNVAAVCFLFYIIFAILCVNYFKGLLMSCQGDAFEALPGEVVSFLEDPLPWSEMSSGQREWFGPLSNVSEAFSGDGFSSSIGGNLSTSRVEYCDVITGGLWPDAAACCSAWPTSAEEAPTSYEVCECLGLSWAETIPQQFDNVAVSLLTLFEISTTEAWTSVTYAAVDATGVGMQPIRDHVIARVWLFILFMLLGAYLVMNLFVGVIVDNFKKMKARAEEGGLLVTEHQRLWIKTQLIMRRLRPMKRPQPPPDRLGSSCFRLINLPWFDPAVMVCIVLNTVVLAMDYFGQSNLYTRVLELLLYVLYTLFTLEALAKILALRWAYFKDPWNRFDFFIVLGSTAGLLSLLFLDSNYGTVITVIRTFRVGRVLRLVRGMGSMSQLFQTLLMTLPSMGNVGALLFLLFFIFAAMGVQLYAKVGLEGALNAQANFRSFWDTMVLLLRFSTGENWNGFMYDVAAERDGCRSDPEYDPDVCGFTSHDNCIPIDGCGSWTIYPYMIGFTFSITFVFLNLFIGVILDGFDSAKEESEDFITEEDFMRFAEHWSNFDPHATCLMSVQDLHSFLQSLFKPWGFGVHYQASSRELRHKVRRLDLFVFDNNKVHFKDVLHALSEEVFRTEAEKKGEVLDYLQGSKRHQLKKGRSIAGSFKLVKRGSSRKALDYMVNPVSNTKVTLDQIYAVEYLQQAFRAKVEQRKKKKEEAAAAAAAAAAAREGSFGETKGIDTPSPQDTSKSGFFAPSPPRSPSSSPAPHPVLLRRDDSRTLSGSAASSKNVNSVSASTAMPSRTSSVVDEEEKGEMEDGDDEKEEVEDDAEEAEEEEATVEALSSPAFAAFPRRGTQCRLPKAPVGRGKGQADGQNGVGTEGVLVTPRGGGGGEAGEEGEGSGSLAGHLEAEAGTSPPLLEVTPKLETQPSVRRWSARPSASRQASMSPAVSSVDGQDRDAFSRASSPPPIRILTPARNSKAGAAAALSRAPSLRRWVVNSSRGGPGGPGREDGGGGGDKGGMRASRSVIISFGASSDDGDDRGGSSNDDRPSAFPADFFGGGTTNDEVSQP